MASEHESVYLGVWTNWSHGSIAGLTLTTTLQNGGLLIAFLALFTTFTGTCFWTIVSFAIHQNISRKIPQSALYHQKQAILRNSETSTAAFWRLSRMSWAWRKVVVPPALLRSVSLPLVLSLATFCAFSTAGVFSSRVATTRGGEVLLVGDRCATLNSSLFTGQNYRVAQSYIASRTRASANYESVCYRKSGSADSCRKFVRDTLPVTVTTGISCPFPGKSKICHSPTAALRLDSGFLNSHSDLGINSPPSSRFLYRTVNECAPIRGEGYTYRNSTQPQWSVQFLYGHYNEGFCESNDLECTLQFADADTHRGPLGSEYSVSAVTRYNVINNDEVFSNDAWRPIQELEVPDADLGVYFLQMKDIRYLEPVTDLWFEALDKVVNRGQKFGNLTSYATELPIRALACVQQYQFCRPSLEEVENCTPLNGIFEATRIASSTLFPQPKDSERFLWSLRAIRDMAGGFHELVKQLKGGSLLASDYVSNSGQGGLPDNQWELELEHWFKFTMADLQRAILEQATGPVVPEAVPFFSAPTSPEARALCGSQKIRSDSYTSFNVLGLILMFSIGSLIMLIAACLPSVAARLQRKKPFSSIEWVTNDTLQLQRLAHEAVGAGQWQGACDDYPRTRKGDLLAVIDISNKEHPVLRAPAAAEMVKEAEQAEESQDEEQGMGEQRSEGSVEERSEGLNMAGPRGERKAEWQRNDSIHESLMSVEIPRVSLELSHRFAAEIC